MLGIHILLVLPRVSGSHGAVAVEGGHRKGGGDSVLHFRGEDLVIYGVIVAAIDAATPRRGAEEIEDLFVVCCFVAVHHHP